MAKAPRKPPVKKSGSSRPAPGKRAPVPTIEVEIEKIDTEGIGVGTFENKEVLVAGTLPGEKVVVGIEHKGQRRIIGRLHKLLSRNPNRCSSPCGMAKACLGCSLIQMNYDSQVYFKKDKVRHAFNVYESLKRVEVRPVWKAENPLGYRTNAKLVMEKQKGKVKIGLYRRGSHEIVDIGDCPLQHPLINKVVQAVREEGEKQDIYVYNPKTKRGLLRYLMVKVSPSANKAMVTFVTTERNFKEITWLAKGIKKRVPEIISVQQNVNASEGNVIAGRDTLKMMGTHDLIDRVGDVRLRIAPTSFFQVNNEQAARIYDLVRKWADLKKDEVAVDLYCGIGGIALNLAKDAGKVIGIESVEDAVRNARENARFNDINGCTFHAGDAAELVQDLSAEVPPGSVAVVNPPRSGCAREVLKALTSLSPRTLIYVSCNPETLARDLDILRSFGYAALEVQPVDMFPQTPHVETVVRLAPIED